MNYFELFNLDVSFNVDLSGLATTYQKLQQLTHPDKFATASDRDRLLSVQKNAQVNDGYQTLKSPLSRAEYMLNLKGIDLQHEQTTLQDNAFLMQQMEWREQLEEIDDELEPEQKLAELDDEIKDIIKAKFTELAQLFIEDTEQTHQSAAMIIRKLKFMYKLRQEIERKDEQLNDF
jgi:molecular chaperone HscB